MATQSIFHNIIIQDSKTAEAFVTALENTADAADKITPKKVSSRDLSKEEIINFFGAVTNAYFRDIPAYIIREDACQNILSFLMSSSTYQNVSSVEHLYFSISRNADTV